MGTLSKSALSKAAMLGVWSMAWKWPQSPLGAAAMSPKERNSKNRLGVVRRLPQMFKWETRVVQGIPTQHPHAPLWGRKPLAGRRPRLQARRKACCLPLQIRPSNGESDCREKHLGMTIVDHHAARFHGRVMIHPGRQIGLRFARAELASEGLRLGKLEETSHHHGDHQGSRVNSESWRRHSPSQSREGGSQSRPR